MYDFSINHRAFETSNIINIHKYLMKKHSIKCLGLIKNCLLTVIVSASNHTKCMLLSNQKCMTQPTFINLHPNEYSQELHYYPFAIR